jgi:malonyl-CoA/methylmalonyl-CoA synthetase
MIERSLAALEAVGTKEVEVGLDAAGDVVWRRSATELLSAVGGWQQVLRARGVGPGDRVALDLGRGPGLLPAHLAVLAAGACVVPVNSALTKAERKRVFERAELAALLSDADQPDRGAAVALAQLSSDRPALLIFTSGTTGEPKGVPLSLENLEANLAGLAATWGLVPDDRILHTLPAHHVHGLALALYGSARLGMAITWMPRFDAEQALGALAEHACTVFMGVPTMYHRFVGARAEPDLGGMRVFISGSAPLSPHDFHAFEERFGQRPLERYGLSETMIVSSNPLAAERRPGTVGLSLPETEVELAEDGEILVRGPAVMSSYWRDDTATQASFRNGAFCTGDLGRRDEAGYLIIAGRKKELIIVGGSNVLPGEVEQVLAADPGIDEIAAAGLPDADRGEIVAAFVVPRAGEDTAALEARLRERADENLAAYKRPRAYHFLAELPRNAMGKVDRRRLTS